MAPCLIDDDRDGIAEIQATIAANHWQADFLRILEVVVNGGGKTSGLGTEKKRVAGRKTWTYITLGSKLGHRKQAWFSKRQEAVFEVLMFCDIRQIVIVETGPPAGLGVEGEPKWFDEMQVGTGIRAQPDDVAGVRRYLRRE